MHISKVEIKTAAAIVKAELNQNKEHEAIKQDPAVMIEAGMGEASFICSYPSDSTVWSFHNQGHMVHRSEWIS